MSFASTHEDESQGYPVGAARMCGAWSNDHVAFASVTAEYESYGAFGEALLQGNIERLNAISPESSRAALWTVGRAVQGNSAVLDEDPESPCAQELAGRWLQLLRAFEPKGEIDPQCLRLETSENKRV
jgi:hypothetical protein